MDDLISRYAAISLPVKPKEDRYFQTQNLDDAYEYGWCDLQGCIEKLLPVRPDLTDEDMKLIKQLRSYHNGSYAKVIDKLLAVASAQPEPYLDSIVSEIENTISETKKRGRHHEIHIRTNGEMICYGLQLALEIIEEKRNEQTT